MTPQDFLSLFLIAVVFVISPGPGTLAVFAKSLSRGFIPAFSLSLGMVIGDLVYLAAVVYSLGAFSQTILSMIDIVRLVGGGYLFYLGYKTWKSAYIPSTKIMQKNHHQELATGFLISITNPKVMVFYIAVLPAFIRLENINHNYALQVMIAVGLGLLLGISAFNFFATKLKLWFDQAHGQKRINHISGAVMMLVGVLLALS